MRAQGDARVRVVLLQWYCALLVLPLCSSVLAATSAFYPFVIDQDNLSGVSTSAISVTARLRQRPPGSMRYAPLPGG